MWTPASITALVVAVGGVISGIAALVHSVRTRQATAAIGQKVTRLGGGS